MCIRDSLPLLLAPSAQELQLQGLEGFASAVDTIRYGRPLPIGRRRLSLLLYARMMVLSLVRLSWVRVAFGMF
eukprot:664543-Pyramimonas_sp.AAC.1